MCQDDRDAMPEIAAIGLGEMECDWLQLVRLQCTSYEHNHAEGIDRAFNHAEKSYGADNGPGIAGRVAALIRAMREERRGGFGYLSPYCPSCRLRITGDEWKLIELMQAGYRGDRPAISRAAADFARNPDAPVLSAAAARFGAAVAAALGGPGTRIAAPERMSLH